MRSTTLASAKSQYEANSFASAASSLASSTGTPWAAYDADFYAAQAANVTAVSNAAKTNAIAQATAQKTAEVAQTNAETTWRNAYATASSVLNTGIAGAHLGFATAQSLIYSAMGGSNLALPTVSRPTDLAGEYTVPGPDNTYRASISAMKSTNYYYYWWGGYWWGAWGYYGSGYWYSGYGGYYGYLYGSQVSSAASVILQEPQKQFPGSFWQIDSDQIADQMRDGAIEVRYGDTKVSELVMPVDVPVGSLQSINIPVRSSDDAVTSEEVAAILKSKDDELADFVSDKASITTLPVRERPVVYVAAHYQSTDDSPQAPTKEKQGSADDRFYITVPAQWNAETVAAAVQQAARGEESPLQNGAQIRSLFLKHIDSRTPGFEVRQTGRFAGASVHYRSSDAVVTLESGVFWRSYKQETFFGGQVGTTTIDTKIGVLASNGWVRLLSGERATLSSLQKWSRSFRGASNDQINTTLDALISPFHVDTSASQLGIFIGGTGMHFLGLGNVERLYNVYDGSKFYYGGIGNPIDYDSSKDFHFDGGFGLGWTTILDRAVADIQMFLQPGQEIHIFGFSRGAAMANELAKRLADLGMRVAFVGMYDPVYSVGRAGQNSRYVDSTYAGAAGNYVNGTISGNVDAAAVLYAINEDRSFFPATQFTPQGSTKLLTMMSPGAHSDIGGHFENNLL
ncbi:MAG: DUF2235 domain-containing protein, partial [Planctomycetes bacterium]|nr:DUF2235 domain-containing protein [Planctomycetota bacterium]